MTYSKRVTMRGVYYFDQFFQSIMIDILLSELLLLQRGISSGSTEPKRQDIRE